MSNAEVTQVLKRALTVRELIEALEDFDGDDRVVFACDYGDYHHTTQALPVREIERPQGVLAPSAYSHSGVAIVGDDEDGEDANVVVLS